MFSSLSLFYLSFLSSPKILPLFSLSSLFSSPMLLSLPDTLFRSFSASNPLPPCFFFLFSFFSSSPSFLLTSYQQTALPKPTQLANATLEACPTTTTLISPTSTEPLRQITPRHVTAKMTFHTTCGTAPHAPSSQSGNANQIPMM